MGRKTCHESIHHRKCLSNGGNNDHNNVMWTSRKRHQAYHLLFQNWEVPRIVEELNRWIDPDWVVIARRKY